MEEKLYVYIVFGTWEFGEVYCDTFKSENNAQKYIDREYEKSNFDEMLISKVKPK